MTKPFVTQTNEASALGTSPFDQRRMQHSAYISCQHTIPAMKFIFFTLIVSLLVFSCKKDNIDVASFWQCHSSQNLDSAAISIKITGSWKWKTQYCFWIDKTTKADKKIKVPFNSNAIFTVVENSSIITQGNWRLKIVDIGSWRLDLTSPSIYLNGRILFCTKQILFNNSYIDGCDNLFEKAN